MSNHVYVQSVFSNNNLRLRLKSRILEIEGRSSYKRMCWRPAHIRNPFLYPLVKKLSTVWLERCYPWLPLYPLNRQGPIHIQIQNILGFRKKKSLERKLFKEGDLRKISSGFLCQTGVVSVQGRCASASTYTSTQHLFVAYQHYWIRIPSCIYLLSRRAKKHERHQYYIFIIYNI